MLALLGKSVSPLLGQTRQVCMPPIVLENWQAYYMQCDKDFSSYIIQGIKSDFRISFDGAQPLHPASTNLYSTHPSVISNYLDYEASLTRMWKFPRHCSPPGTYINPLGVIPKKNKLGKWHLIVGLSSQASVSVNDGISQELPSLSYTSLDHLVALVISVGRGCDASGSWSCGAYWGSL